MARTLTGKLIISKGKGGVEYSNGLLFDLEKDPLEMNNLFNEPAHKNDLVQLMSAIQAWLSNTKLQKTYINEDAPQINQPNVPPDLSHRNSMKENFRKKMKESSH